MMICHTNEHVPRITVNGNEIRSDSGQAPHLADVCARWAQADMRKARKLLREGNEVICRDATAHAALISLSLDMMNRGKMPKTTLKQMRKAYLEDAAKVKV